MTLRLPQWCEATWREGPHTSVGAAGSWAGPSPSCVPTPSWAAAAVTRSRWQTHS